ncbi:VCBS domain-containing protein [Catenovulum agarivorans]|uniref:VCBS domain-containing protein n=1 Tax=Catenovulum agarivorans TaxID=1172192 RepID=UPI00030FEF8B|nr:VCBS domain-containing protein [Catenovulum agarivorans]
MLKIFCVFFLAISVASCGGSSSKDGDQEQISGKQSSSISGKTASSYKVYEDSIITGSLSTSNLEASFVAQNQVEGKYGKLSINADGKWTYQPNKFHYETIKTQNVDELVDVFTISTTDGEEQDVTLSAKLYYQRLDKHTSFTLSVAEETTYSGLSRLFDSKWISEQLIADLTPTNYDYDKYDNLTSVIRFNAFRYEVEHGEEYNYLRKSGKVTTIQHYLERYFLADGNLFLYESNESTAGWDSTNNRISEVENFLRTMASNGEISRQSNYKERLVYNENGRKSEVYVSTDDVEEFLATSVNYHIDGTADKSILLTSVGEQIRQYNYYYDAYGRMIANKTTYPNSPDFSKLELYVYHPNINVILKFIVNVNEFSNGSLTSNVFVNLYQYSNISSEKCGDVDRAKSVISIEPISNCRINDNLPQTTALPNPSALGY